MPDHGTDMPGEVRTGGDAGEADDARLEDREPDSAKTTARNEVIVPAAGDAEDLEDLEVTDEVQDVVEQLRGQSLETGSSAV